MVPIFQGGYTGGTEGSENFFFFLNKMTSLAFQGGT